MKMGIEMKHRTHSMFQTGGFRIDLISHECNCRSLLTLPVAQTLRVDVCGNRIDLNVRSVLWVKAVK